MSNHLPPIPDLSEIRNLKSEIVSTPLKALKDLV
jgi:hypothetical protein